MKKSLFTLIAFFFLFSNYSIGQNCQTGTDDPPGCFYDCRTWSALNEPFSADSALPNLNCGANGLTRWFNIRPTANLVSISMSRFNCSSTSEVNVQIYDGSFNAISGCTSFDLNDFSGILSTSSFLPNRDLSVRVETNEPTGCDFELALDGILTAAIPRTDTLTVIGDSLVLRGTVHLDSVSNATDFEWTSSNPLITIDSGLGTQSITYSKPRFESGIICLEVFNDCSSSTECVDIEVGIPACDLAGDSFPGCDYRCKGFWALDEQFVPNSSVCSGNGFSKWFKIRMVDSTLRIFADRNNCDPTAEFNVQLFNLQQNPLSSCVSFRNDNYLTQELLDTNLVFFEEYAVLIESNTEIGCDFNFIFQGSERMALPPIPNIIFFATNTLPLNAARVDLVPEAASYQWEVKDSTVSILSGQGTSQITFSNPNNNTAEFCVTPISYCKIGIQKCQRMSVSPLIGNLNPCCESPGNPAGCTEAGVSISSPCVICNLAGIYSGNNGQYDAAGNFSCGIPHNSAYVSIIADAMGAISAIVITDLASCTNNPVEGLQLILWDQAGNELACFSAGASPTANVSASGLTPGALYTFQIDGFHGDACDYTLIVSGNTGNILPDPVGPISMIPDTILCPGASVCFEIDPINGAQLYEWSVPANIRITSGGGENDLFVCGIVESAGGGALRVTPSNFCFNGIPGILPIVSVPIPPVLWPPIFVCQSDMPFDTMVKGQVYTFDSFGGHQIDVVTELGCDSTISLSLIPNVQVPGFLDTTIAAGTCFMVEDSCYSAGDYIIPLKNSIQANGCDSTLALIVSFDSTVVVTSDFSVDVMTICPDETANFTYTGSASATASYDWNFGNGTIVSGSGAGPYVIRFPSSGDIAVTLSVTESGVTSPTTTNVVSVYPSLLPLSLTCNSTVDQVTFTWIDDPSVSNYNFNITTGQTGVQSGNSFIISNLNPAEAVTMEVIAESSFGCADISDVQTCVAQDCPMVAVSIDAVPAICLTASALPIQLTGQAGNNTGNFEWSGVGVSSTGEFNPNIVGAGAHQVTLNYTVGACVYSNSTTIQVNPAPVADFTVDSPICIGDVVNVNFTGVADTGANYDWNFNGGNIRSGSAAGPYQIEYFSSGAKTISLSIEQNGCSSNISTQTIEVEAELAPFTIGCTPTLTSITFTWAPIAGAINYRVNTLMGPSGILDGTTYHVDGLNPGDQVTIEVIAEGNSCGNSSSILSCTAQDCPVISIDVEPVNDICLTASTQPIQLVATAGNNSGIFTFSGNGVSNNGIFDPQMAAIGTNVITVVYTEGTCSYNGSIMVEINETPTADFSLSSPICLSEMASISYSGSASANANFNWNFGSGTVATGSNAGPYEISFSSPGIETISLMVEENGCTSTVETNTLQVDQLLTAPVIVCQNAMLDGVSFEWNDDPNISDYQVQVSSGQAGVLNGNVYTVTGLSPGEIVSITVTGNSANSCPSVSSSFECESIVCPTIDLTIEPLQNVICAGDSTIVQLVATNSSQTQLGTYTWSGTNVSVNGEFNTAGLMAGEFQVSVEYNEMGCISSSTQIVTIESSPDLNATVNSPIWFLGGIGSIDLDIMNGMPPYITTFSSQGTMINQIDSLSPGEYTVSTVDENGCDVEESFTISAGVYSTSPIHIICTGDVQPLKVSPETGATFSWTPSLRLSCNDCPSPLSNPRRSTQYTVTATLPDGRSASQIVTVIVLPSIVCNGIVDDDDQDLERLVKDVDLQNISEKELENLEKEITNFYLEKEVKVVPNPTDGIVNIVTPEKVEQIEVFDFSGKLLKSEQEKQINLSKLAKGVYFFKIKIADQMIIKKVILI